MIHCRREQLTAWSKTLWLDHGYSHEGKKLQVSLETEGSKELTVGTLDPQSYTKQQVTPTIRAGQKQSLPLLGLQVTHILPDTSTTSADLTFNPFSGEVSFPVSTASS